MARIKAQGSPCVLRLRVSQSLLCAKPSPTIPGVGRSRLTPLTLLRTLAGAFFSTVRPWTVLKSGQTILGLALAAPIPAAAHWTKALIRLALHGPPLPGKLSFVDMNDDESRHLSSTGSGNEKPAVVFRAVAVP